MSQSTAMVMLGCCLYFLGLPPNIGDTMICEMCFKIVDPECVWQDVEMVSEMYID